MADRWPVESRRRILVGVILARAALPYERWSAWFGVLRAPLKKSVEKVVTTWPRAVGSVWDALASGCE